MDKIALEVALQDENELLHFKYSDYDLFSSDFLKYIQTSYLPYDQKAQAILAIHNSKPLDSFYSAQLKDSAKGAAIDFASEGTAATFKQASQLSLALASGAKQAAVSDTTLSVWQALDKFMNGSITRGPLLENLGESFTGAGVGVGVLVGLNEYNKDPTALNAARISSELATGTAIIAMAQPVFEGLFIGFGLAASAPILATVGAVITAAAVGYVLASDWQKLVDTYSDYKAQGLAHDLAAQQAADDFVSLMYNDLNNPGNTQDILNHVGDYYTNFGQSILDLENSCGVGTGPLPDWLLPAKAIQELGGGGYPSPLILDLNGDGAHSTNLGTVGNASTVYFDMDNDGFAERTAWVSAGDGLLAIDKNGNGSIDNQGELFGNNATYADGFANLAQYDSNHDSKITAADTQFANLKVWIDANNNGITDSGELYSLTSLGITSISLTATQQTGIYDNENVETATSTFTINGQTREIADDWFRVDQTDTQYLGNVTLNPDVLFLPTLKGFGTLMDLHVAMSADATLLNLVQTFASSWTTKNFGDHGLDDTSQVDSILFRWAGADVYGPDDTINGVNARDVVFLEKLTGSDYNGSTANLSAIHNVFNNLEASLDAQAGAQALFDGLHYSVATGAFSGDAVLSAAGAAQIASDIAAISPSNIGNYWQNLNNFLVDVKAPADYTPGEVALLQNIWSQSYSGNWIDTAVNYYERDRYTFTGTDLSDTLIGYRTVDSISGQGGDDYISGQAGNDILHGDDGNDTIYGGSGGDQIEGGTGNDYLEGGTGDDILDAGTGNDIYTYNIGDGNDVINDTSGFDIINIKGILNSDLGFHRTPYSIYDNTLLNLTITVQGQDSVTLDNHFLVDGLEQIKLDDGSIIDLTQFKNIVGTAGDDILTGDGNARLLDDNISGGQGNDTLNGGLGNDILYGDEGNDRLDGGAGNDRLEGGGGDSTYIYANGSDQGRDVISDYAGMDTIILGSSYTSSNVTLERVGLYDLALVSGGQQIVYIENQFQTTYSIENLQYGNGTVLNLMTYSHTLNGTSGDDNLTGISYGGGGDIINGLDGNDAIAGGSGNDIASGGNGNDDISGQDGDDTLRGDAGDDNVNGGEGNDTLIYDSGYDVFSGDGGMDVVQVTNAAFTAANMTLQMINNGHTYLNVSFSGTLAFSINDQFYDGAGVEAIKFSDGSTYDLTNVTYNVNGTSGSDSLDGTGEGIGNPNNVITGLAGDDGIYGLEGNDTITGGTGNDSIWGGTGNDIYIYNSGDGVDLITEGGGYDTIQIGTGFIKSDLTWTRNNDDLVLSLKGVQVITIQGQFNNYTPGGYDPKVELIKFSDGSTLALDALPQTINGTAGDDSLNGTNSSYDIISGLGGDDVIQGFAGNDTLSGGDGNDNIYGYEGDDLILGGNGNDNLDGGDGIDTVSYSDATAAVTINLTIAGTQVTGGSGSDSVSNFENLTGSAYNDTLTGDGNNNIIVGGAGNDTINGGAGNDTVSYSTATAGVTVNLATTTAQNTVGAGTDTITGFENILGSAYADTLTGDGNANIIEGGAGNDILSGAAGIDTVSFASSTAGVTVNLVTTVAQNTVGAGTDTITGFENILGSAYNDTLTGDANANTIEGGLGNDVMDGSTGTDTVSYAGSFSGVTVNLATTTAQNTIGAGTDTITNFENLTGSAFNDTLTGDANANTINGGDANDIIIGGLGNDILIGGLGIDTLSYSTATAAITASLALTTAQNTINAGTDTVSGFENLTGSGYNDTLSGDSNANVIDGGAGNDIVDGGFGDDILIGGAGTDTVTYLSATGAVTVNLALITAQDTLGAGVDTISGFENLTGSSYNDILIGNASANTIDGGSGNDIADGGAGSDILTGGAGTDTISYASASSAITLNLATTTAQNTVGSGSDTVTGFENILGSAYNDTLTGDANNNVIDGGAGNDILNGSAGIDTLSYASAAAAITANLSLTTAQNTINAGTDTVSGFENLTGSNFDDTLFGDTNANTIDGGAGNDLIYADAGNDILLGNSGIDTLSFANITSASTVNLATTTAQNTVAAGTDTITGFENVIGSAYNDTLTGDANSNIIEGGLGNDTLIGGGGIDTLSYASATAAITASLTLTIAQNTVGAGTDTVSGFENLLGSNYNDTLTGDGNANLINGGSGNDIIIGGLGDDILIGGLGIDTLSYSTATAAVTASLAIFVAQDTIGAGIDTIGSFENLTGSGFNDTLTGDSNANTIDGGAGNDLIEGGAGNDILIGGSGTDTLSYASATFGIVSNLSVSVAQNTGAAGTDTVSGFENLIGSAFNDILTGDLNANTINGGTGNDIIDGGAGNDTLIGGVDIDTLSYLSATGGVTANLSLTTAQNTVNAGTDTVSGFENLTGSNYSDILTGDANANTINGGNGNDTIDGGLGNDILIGGDGNDTLSYANATAAITISLASAAAQNTGAAGIDSISQFENIIGSAYNDKLTGDLYDNIISGGAGNDIMDGGLGNDTVSYSSATAAVTINLATLTSQNTVGAGSDTITNFENILGSAFNDTLTGDANSNILEGGAGNDVISGGTGVDTLSYLNSTAAVTVNIATTTAQNTVGAGTDTITGFENILGSAFADTLTGDANNNVIEGGAGNDVLNGAGGIDTLSYGSSLAGVTVNLTTTTAQNTIGAGSDTISNFENINGSSFDDVLTGTSGDNNIDGSAGNDTINGGAGNDVLSGGAGIDTLTYSDATAGITIDLSLSSSQVTGGSGTDIIFGFENIIGSGFNDVLTGTAVNNIINGGAGTDTIGYSTAYQGVVVSLALSTAQDTIGAGVDTLTNFENLTGSSYDDQLTGNASANSIDAGAGNDIVDGGAGNDILNGGLGNDTVSYASAIAAVTVNLATITSQNTVGAGSDTITNFENILGSGYADTLTGDANNNIIEGGVGNDVLTGGGGIDTASFEHAAAAITVNLATTTSQNTIGAGSDTITGFENILGSAFNDTLTGDGNANFIEGGTGNDIMDGATGTDTLSYLHASSGVTVNLATTTAQNTIGAGTDTISNFENIIGSYFDDHITGNTGSNIIEGGYGNDILDGAAGTDTLSYLNSDAGIHINLGMTTAQDTLGAGIDTVTNFENITGSSFDDDLWGNTGVNTIDGGAGNDIIHGGLGNDILTGGSGIDTVSFSDATTLVTVNLATLTSQNTGGGGSDTITGFENLIGSNYNDTLTGDANNNTIEGGLGNDILNGAGGIDTISYEHATAGITLNLATTTAQNTVGAGSDTISNFENIFASMFNDTLIGNIGNNVINGSGGADTLTGGTGADTFVFDASSLGTFDTITDFSTSQGDKLDISNVLFNYDPLQSAIDDFITFTTSGSNTVVSIDQDGTGALASAQHMITLNGVTGLDADTLLANGNLIA